jgi:hypothetical protein
MLTKIIFMFILFLAFNVNHLKSVVNSYPE